MNVEFATIAPFLVKLNRWMTWQEQERNGKKTKVPRTAAGRAAKSTDATTWCDFLTASGVLKLNLAGFDGIGIALGQLDSQTGELLGGIDLDSCLDADGSLADWAVPIVTILPTYIEISPSGTGLKAFFRSSVADLDQLRTAFAIAATKFGTKKSVLSAANGQEHGPAIEVYLGHGRYFATTGRRWANAQADVALLDLPALLAIAELVRQATGTVSKDKTKKPTKAKPGRDRTRSATAFRLGMQLHRDGKTFDEMCAALRANPDTEEWCREKGDIDNGRELRRIWEGAERAARGRTLTIRIVQGELDRLADEGETAIIAADADIFQRGPLLVRPGVSKLPAADGGTTWAAALHEVGVYGLLDEFCRTAQWQKLNAQQEWVPANPPPTVANILHNRVGAWNVPPCRGVLMTPTLRLDGSLLKAPGFDPATSYYLWLPPDLHVPEIPERPTKAESEAALQKLESLLTEFPFADPASKSVGLSLIMCAVVRAAILVCPIHGVSSPTAGSGKSYLCDIAAGVATGNRCPVIFAGNDKSELEKKINGMLLAGVSLFSLDNLDQPLAGDLLCQAAERPLLDLRRLGKSDPVRSLNGALIGATGNNLATMADLARRVLEARLDRGIERPELHRFQNNPMQRVLANRGEFIAAVLTVVRGCLCVADAPDPSPFASYEGYSKFIRAPLIWLNRADPLLALVGERGTDPVRDELVAMMAGWETTIGLNTAITAASIAQHAAKGAPSPPPNASKASFDAWAEDCDKWKEFGPLVNATCGSRGHASSREIGDWLRRYKDRVIAGRQFVRSDNKNGAKLWRLVPAKIVPTA